MIVCRHKVSIFVDALFLILLDFNKQEYVNLLNADRNGLIQPDFKKACPEK